MNAIAQASSLPVAGPKLDFRRVCAGFIDVVIVGVGAVAILAVAGALGSERPIEMPGFDFLILGWALYYYFACESSGGQTFGKRLLKLRVVRVDGSPAGMGEVAVRTLLRVIDGIALYLVGLIVMLVTGERRGRLGDLAGGTMIVDASAPATTPAPAAAAPVDAEQVAPSLAPSATITLPPRPAAPPVAAPELRPFEPELVGEPVEPEPLAVEPEPVVVEPEPPVVEPEPVLVEPEPPLAEMASPSLQELAQDLAELRGADPEPETATEPVVNEPVVKEPVDEEPAADDEPVTVRSVETVSAIDLVMGEDEDDDDSDSSPSPQH
jgi:uncharacterized RDD family membrane protein YckC